MYFREGSAASMPRRLDSGPVGHQSQLSTVLDVEGCEQGRDMRFDGSLANPELARDRDVVSARREPAHHVALAWRDALPQTMLAARFDGATWTAAEPRRSDEHRHIRVRGFDLRIERAVCGSLPQRRTDHDDSSVE